MSRYELLVAIYQTLKEIKENLKNKVDCTAALREDCILFSCVKENGRVQVYKIEVKAL